MAATDIVIAGAGLVGRLLALALRQASGGGLSLRLLEAAPAGRAPQDIRVYAIAASTRRMLEQLDVWPSLAPHAEAARALRIGDGRLADAVRPILLTLAGEVTPGEPFAHFVDGRELGRAVAAACDAAGIAVEHERRIGALEVGPRGVSIRGPADRGQEDSARLVVGADGAGSAVRRAAGIATIGWPYRQGAIITIVWHEVPHDGVAIQHFLPGGPFALLPLPGRRSGIVWTERFEDAERLIALPHDLLAEELRRRAGPEVGDLRIEEPPRLYPLGLGLARTFVKPRIALVGDAAHRLHPLAGLGLNLGLRDVAALVEVLVEAARRGEDIGSIAVLERYQRWRRFDTVEVAVATEALNRLFSNDLGPLRLIRDLGLGLVDRIAPLKRHFVREAAGTEGRLPRLMRGEPV